MFTILTARLAPKDHNGQLNNPIHGLILCVMIVVDTFITTLVLNTL